MRALHAGAAVALGLLATLASAQERVSFPSFDGAGNYNMGLKEQLVFPEINYDKVDKVRGMNITICTTARTDEEARALLEGFDVPFQK